MTLGATCTARRGGAESWCPRAPKPLWVRSMATRWCDGGGGQRVAKRNIKRGRHLPRPPLSKSYATQAQARDPHMKRERPEHGAGVRKEEGRAPHECAPEADPTPRTWTRVASTINLRQIRDLWSHASPLHLLGAAHSCYAKSSGAGGTHSHPHIQAPRRQARPHLAGVCWGPHSAQISFILAKSSKA